ncbi:MAG: discoidin domain-containing protein, partial [Bifidobacteriaceae bacterium]|nr:discoidin domain-containing protein [Bifidobacteriaceae bacterium]
MSLSLMSRRVIACGVSALVAAAGAVVSTGPAAFADGENEIHVAVTGDDASGDGSSAAPYQTINHAAQLAQPGDTVLVHAGLYRELVQPVRGGTDENTRITYTAAGDGEVVVKGSEEINTWVKHQGDVWSVRLPNTYFGDFNPYSTRHPLTSNGFFPVYTAGDVYLDEVAYYQRGTVEAVVAEGGTWYNEVTGSETTIYANFAGENPNDRLAEINVRRQIFAPSVWGLGFITLRGMTFKHAAGTYSDFPDAVERRQAGAVSTYGGLKWIIEENTVINARTIGIDIGLGCDLWAANRGNPPYPQARTNFRNTDLYGQHIVRGNYIAKSGQSGIAGVFSWKSQLLYNMIEDTNYRNEFSGSETAPIKVHYMNDGLIKGNYVRNSSGGNSGGIWTDWGNQGVRVTGNIVYNAPWGYYAEAVHGPILVDNNVFINDSNLRVLDGTGIVYANNLFLDSGNLLLEGWGRDSYWFDPHTMNEHNATQNVQKFWWLNNLVQGMTLPNDSSQGSNSRTNVKEGNAVGAMSDISVTSTTTAMTLNFTLDTESITGLTPVTQARVGAIPRVGEEIPANVTEDYFGNPIGETDLMAGPFATAVDGTNSFALWPPTGQSIATPPAPSSTAAANLSVKPSTTATASNEAAANRAAALAIDGSASTRWAASSGDDAAFIDVNLGGVFDVTKVVLSWHSAYARGYELHISDDGETWQTVYTTASGTGGTVSVPVRRNTQYVRMQGVEPATANGYSLYEFEVWGRAVVPVVPVNVAEGLDCSTYRASSESNDGEGVSDVNDRRVCRAFDGLTTTRWGSDGGDTQWIQVDLGRTHRIDKVTLMWESAYADAYEIQVSPNGSTWTTVDSHTDATPVADHTDVIEFATPVEGRFVRMQGVHAATQWGLSLYEFQVWGAPKSSGEPPVTPTGPMVAKSTTYPQNYGEWANGLLAGNGRQSIIMFGNPRAETVVFGNKDFYAARTEADPHRTFNTVSQADLATIRSELIAGNYQAANTLAASVQGYHGGGEGSKHPGFEMTMDVDSTGAIANYYRISDYSSGVMSVNWSDTKGHWQREAFVSRPDDMTVQYLSAPQGTTFNVTLGVGLDAGMHMISKGYVPTNVSDTDYLNLRVAYPTGRYDAGYEGVTRIVTDGTKTMDGEDVRVSGATYVMLLTKTKRYNGTYDGGVPAQSEWNQRLLQAELAAVTDDYATLRARHVDAHSEIMDRVALSFGASPTDQAKTTEQLITEQKGNAAPMVPALYERLFYAGRYHLLASSGANAAPDLLGNWTGDSDVGWDGNYHLDANLNLQISGGNIGNMPEAMAGYFWLNHQWQTDFRTNATKLLGTRGMLTGGNTPNGEGLISNIDYDYPYQYVTGGMSWLLYPFWEYYQITGDQQFLEDEYYPLIRDMGDFYEDFLEEKDANGKYIFAGSISPENRPAGGAAYPPLTVNSVYDISGAKFALTTLIETATTLGEDAAKIPVWRELLDNLPPYIVNSEGTLSEWAWPDLAERNQYTHRHSSGLMPIWPYGEITPETSLVEFNAAKRFLQRKDEGTYENAGHGLLHGALVAANLNQTASVRSKLVRFVRDNYYYASLGTAHYNGYNVFCTDVANSVPTILMEMLVSSEPGTLELLPALPTDLGTGSVQGLLAKGQVTINNLAWDYDARTVSLTLTSAIDQDLTLIKRPGIAGITSDDIAPESSPLGNIARVLPLAAGETVTVELTLTDPTRINIAPGLAASAYTASSQTDAQHGAAQAFDADDAFTAWTSEASDANAYVQVDLGQTYVLREIALAWVPGSHASAYTLQTSTNGTDWTDVYTATDAEGGTKSALIGATGRYVRMQATQPAGSGGYSLYEMEVYGSEPSDVALNKPTRAIGGESTHPKEDAVDGDTTTRWAAGTTANNGWIDVDLGGGDAKYYTIYRVAIRWEAAYARAYRIQTSYDGAEWTDVFTEANGNGGWDYIDLDPVTTRFVRMQGVTRAINYGYSIYDLEVYGAENPGFKVPLNYTTVESALAAYAALNPTAYTTSSWASAFEDDPVGAAEAIMTDDDATQDDVNAAATAVTGAIASLVRRAGAAALAGLDALVDAVAAFAPQLGLYTGETAQGVRDALEAAEALLDADPADVAVGAVSAAHAALLVAIAALEPAPPAADPSLLQAAVTEAALLTNDDGRFTTQSWADFSDALDAAQDVLDDAEASQSAIDQALTALVGALADLAGGALPPAPPDKTGLQALTDVADALTNTDGQYTSETWDALQAALASAGDVLDDADATQAEITAVLEALAAALAGLTPTPPGDAPDPSVLTAVIAVAEDLSNADGAYSAQSWL